MSSWHTIEEVQKTAMPLVLDYFENCLYLEQGMPSLQDEHRYVKTSSPLAESNFYHERNLAKVDQSEKLYDIREINDVRRLPTDGLTSYRIKVFGRNSF